MVSSAAATFRAKRIPLDAIVQDWHYWGDLGWGPQWDPKVYPDPAAMVANLTANDLKLMVSVWSKFDPQTKFYKGFFNTSIAAFRKAEPTTGPIAVLRVDGNVRTHARTHAHH